MCQMQDVYTLRPVLCIRHFNTTYPFTVMDQTATVLFKVKKFWLPAKIENGKAVHTTLLYISLLLLALSTDIESNPGPIQTQVYLEGNSTVFPYMGSVSPGPAKRLNAMLASYGTMPTVRTYEQIQTSTYCFAHVGLSVTFSFPINNSRTP